MEHLEFVEKLLTLQAEFQLAVFKNDLNEIERLSIRIGKLIVRYLNARKLFINK